MSLLFVKQVMHLSLEVLSIGTVSQLAEIHHRAAYVFGKKVPASIKKTRKQKEEYLKTCFAMKHIENTLALQKSSVATLVVQGE